jgi:hypothetical protein
VKFRRWELFQGTMQWRVYQIKSNAINSMSAVSVTSTGSPTTVAANIAYRKAVISTKANLADVTDPLNPISYGGNLSLTMEAWESTTVTNGSGDKIGVQLVGNASQGMLFSSFWAAPSTTAQVINGGKIKVRNPSVPVTPPPAPRQMDPSAPATQREMDIRVYPNPSNGTFNLELPNTDQKVRIVVTDVSGKTVAIENLDENHSQTIKLNLQNVSQGVYMLHVTNGDQVYRTKLMIQ